MPKKIAVYVTPSKFSQCWKRRSGQPTLRRQFTDPRRHGGAERRPVHLHKLRARPHPNTGPTSGAKKQQPYIFNRRVGSHGGYFVHFFALFKMLCGGCTTTHPPGVHCSQRVELKKNSFLLLKLLLMHKNIYINCKILFVILYKEFFK